jgi:DNA segregation ATPase FtsK/SpoIIIE, S-DNA-T family
MLEWLAIPAVIGVAAFIPKKGMSDEKKIERIFENTNTCIKRGDSLQYPKLKRKIIKDTYTTYLYSLPLGLSESDIEGILPALQDGLNKEVEMELDGILKLSVYSTKLSNWKYGKWLIRPNTWEAPIGMNHHGELYHDFDKYPHMLMGGTTRFGKTVALKGIFHSLLMNNPDDVEFYILDLKAGLEFYKYSGLPQVKRVACDVYEAAEVLNEIVEELKKDELMFRQNNWTNIVDTPIRKRKFIIVDEGAELSPKIIADKTKKKYAEFCQSALSEISRIGGGIGLRLLYCTQYPTKEAVNMAVKMNIVTRVSFIVPEAIGSKVLLDEYGAEKLPAIPGRAIYKVEKKRIIQVPYIDDKMMFQMMEERKDELTNRKPVNDHRHPGHGENQTPTTHT